MSRAVLVAVACLAWAGPARADSLRELFGQANQRYLAGDDAGAIAGYRQLVEAGVDDAEVYFDLATAYARQGRHGRAIQFYERVVRLRPDDTEARRALTAVRAELARKLVARHPEARVQERPPLFGAIAAGFSSDGAAVAFLIAWIGLFGLVGLLRLARRELPRLVTGIAAAGFAVATVVSGALLASKAWSELAAHEAIVVAEEVQAAAGPGPDFEETFTAVEGTRVRVLSREGRWLLVRGPDDHEGWVRRGTIGVL